MGRKKTPPVDIRNLTPAKNAPVPCYYANFACANKKGRKTIFKENVTELKNQARLCIQEEEERMRKELKLQKYEPGLETGDSKSSLSERSISEKHTLILTSYLAALLPEDPTELDEFVSRKSDDSLLSSTRDISVTPDAPTLSPDRTDSSTQSDDAELLGAIASLVNRHSHEDEVQRTSLSVAGTQMSNISQSMVMAASNLPPTSNSQSGFGNGQTSFSNVQGSFDAGGQGNGHGASNDGGGTSPNFKSSSSDSSTRSTIVVDHGVFPMVIDSSSSPTVNSFPTPAKSDTVSQTDNRPKRVRNVPRKLINEVSTRIPTKRKTKAKKKGKRMIAVAKEKVERLEGQKAEEEKDTGSGDFQTG